MRRIFTREQLHAMVWDRAVSRIAPELGISDVMLRKHCKAHAIPLPNARYRGKINAGKQASRTPLPPLPKGVSDQVVITARQADVASPAVRAAITAAQTAPSITTRKPARRSPEVAATIAAARAAKPDMQWGAISGLGSDHASLRVHPSVLPRVAGILAALSEAVQARGWRFAPGTDGLTILVDGEAVGFHIAHTIRRRRHETTPEEQRRLDRWDARHRYSGDWRDRPTLPWYDFEPVNDLRIEVTGWPAADGVPRRIAGTARRSIDERIGDVIVAVAAQAATQIAWSEEQAARARQAEIERLAAARRAHLAKLERERVAWLKERAGRAASLERLHALTARFAPEAFADPQWATLCAWVQRHVDALEAALTPAALLAEASTMEAFQALDLATTGDEDAPSAVR